MSSNQQQTDHARKLPVILAILVMGVMAVWLNSMPASESWQKAGFINFSLGFLMLAGYVVAQVFKMFGLPLITGYIFAGILVGPYVSGLFTKELVLQMRLVDDLALSFIALAAGGSLNLKFLARRGRVIGANVFFLTIVVFALVFLFVAGPGRWFAFARDLSLEQILAMGLLLGVLAVARSPSSAIAIISETKAKGVFTETALGVTVTMDVAVIALFTVAIAGARALLEVGPAGAHVFFALCGEIAISLGLGVLLGKGISYYIKKIGRDLPMVLLMVAFGVSKTSSWLGWFAQTHFDAALHLEPLLLCMAAGFSISNFSKSGPLFMETIDRFSLPVYVLFFSLAGASLNLDALAATWPLAFALSGIRAVGIFGATRIAGRLAKDPPHHRKNAWMAYITQAGVAIGLAQLAEEQFPEIGTYLITVVLAVIAINQITGPVLFKIALDRAGEAGKG